jgi:hypothetical protein
MISPTIARENLEQYVERGRAKAASVIEHVMTSQPVDVVVAAPRLRFSVHPEEATLFGDRARRDRGPVYGPQTIDMRTETHSWRMHENAFRQTADRFGLPMAYASDLFERGRWGAELIASNLQELAGHHGKRVLVRSVGDPQDGAGTAEARGFLSDTYRRLDSRPLLEAVAETWQELGAVPIDGVVTDTRVTLRAILPQVLEVSPGEYVVAGAAWENSDFGRGAHALRAFLYRLICANGATMEQALRQVHLGARLNDDLAYSAKTYELDTKATASALRDVARHLLTPAKVEERLAQLRKADGKEVEAKEVDRLLRKHLTKGEAEEVTKAFAGAETVMLPPGQTMWRLSNALSWVAQKLPNPERRLDFERLAGSVINDQATEAKAA